MKRNLSIPLIGAALSLIGAFFSIILICKHNFTGICPAGSLGCGTEDADGCTDLGGSPYSKLFGIISISVMGLFYYSFHILSFVKLARSSIKESAGLYTLLVFTVFTGILFDLFLAYVNFLVLPRPCILCTYTYIVTLLLAGILYLMYRGGDRMSGADGIDKGVRMSIGNGLISAAITGVVFVLFVVFSKQAASEAKSGGLLPPADVKLYLNDFASLKRVNLSAAGLTSYEGAQSAYITIHDFADFRCPHCYHASLTLKEALERWPGRIRIYYRQFPLDATCNKLVGRKVEGAFSCNGAQAALCAQEQNIFGGIYHGIFDFQNTGMNITPENLQGLTQRLGGEWNRMLTCMSSAKTASALDRDIRDSQTVEVNSTPTIVVQDRLMPAGAPDHKYFLQLMDALVFEKEGKAAYEEFARRKR